MSYVKLQGFGLLESGMVSRKNEVNIMVKNAVDVIFGGLTYWMFGYGLSFGDDEGTNAFCGVGHFFTDSGDADELGWIFAQFVFQASFATTATTIVSGAMAERTKLEAYCVFSLVNTLIYCFPAHWIWAKTGVFNKMGAVDIAGAGAVHLVGGITGLTATLMLKPRRGRFSTPPAKMEMSNPTNALLGMFMLWWGWLGFNCGSTFGISGGKWKLATRSAIVTVMSGVGGGIVSLACSYLHRPNGNKFDLGYLMNGILGGLVGITALCALARPWEGLLIGAIGGIIAVFTPSLLEKIKIDDPVGVIGVHALAASWGILSVGLFAQPDDIENLNVRSGLFYGGGWELLGIQALMIVTLIAWTGLTAFILLYAIQNTIGLRCSVVEEILGADIIEHGIDQTSPEDRVNVIRELRSLGEEIPDFLFRESSGYWRRSARTLNPSSTTTVSKEICDIERKSSIYSLSSSAIQRLKNENEGVTFTRRNDLELLKNNGVRVSINGGLTRSSSKKYRGKKSLMPSFTKKKARLRINGARQKPMELDVSRLEIRDRQMTDVIETVVIETANKPSS
ncbi:putative ammonium transporter 3 [Strongylocentrotus purpuratus]|uniref:Ammonium transporter n=1 Tax=Strongylocentrotus purpuratus TaxID=7668 RepID=A0A7M7SUF9_STRPU|nr:putative ammonium transporter 3 [Strongylocentrotus purpuratus]